MIRSKKVTYKQAVKASRDIFGDWAIKEVSLIGLIHFIFMRTLLYRAHSFYPEISIGLALQSD